MTMVNNKNKFILNAYASKEQFDAAIILLLPYFGKSISEELLPIIIKYCQKHVDIHSVLKKFTVQLHEVFWPLENKNINDNDCIAIAKAMERSKTLTHLSLQMNKIGNSGAEALAEVLKQNSTLTDLDLRGNINITSNGAMSLTTSIVGQKVITKLKFQQGFVGLSFWGYSVAKVFAGSQAERLGVRIGWTLQKTDSVVQQNDLQAIGAVISQRIMSSQVTPFKFVHYKKNNAVTIFSKIPVMKLQKNDLTLCAIDFPNQNICDMECFVLAELLKVNTTLKKLYLQENQIGDDGAEAIGKGLHINLTLIILDLGKNRIADRGAQQISLALETNSILKILQLGYNNITDDGAIQISGMLRKNEMLTDLDLRNNKIDHRGANAIGSALEAIKKFNWLTDWRACVFDEDVGKFFAGAIIARDIAGQRFKIRFDDLHSKYSYEESKLVDEHSEKFNKMEALMHAEEFNEKNKKSGMEEWISSSSDHIARTIPPNTSLQHICLNHELNIIDIESNAKISYTWGGLNDLDAIIISSLLEMNSTLEALHLAPNRISNYGAITIFERLKSKRTLTDLNLNNFLVDSNQIFKLKGLKIDIDFIKILSDRIGKNDIPSTASLINIDLNDEQICLLAKSLKSNTTLTILHLHATLVNTGANAIGEALGKNSMLLELSLRENKIDDNGAISIAESLKKNSVLTEIDLQWNKITDIGANAIGESVCINKVIKYIFLANNKISKKSKLSLQNIANNHSTFKSFGKDVMRAK